MSGNFNDRIQNFFKNFSKRFKTDLNYFLESEQFPLPQTLNLKTLLSNHELKIKKKLMWHVFIFYNAATNFEILEEHQKMVYLYSIEYLIELYPSDMIALFKKRFTKKDFVNEVKWLKNLKAFSRSESLFLSLTISESIVIAELWGKINHLLSLPYICYKKLHEIIETIKIYFNFDFSSVYNLVLSTFCDYINSPSCIIYSKSDFDYLISRGMMESKELIENKYLIDADNEDCFKIKLRNTFKITSMIGEKYEPGLETVFYKGKLNETEDVHIKQYKILLDTVDKDIKCKIKNEIKILSELSYKVRSGACDQFCIPKFYGYYVDDNNNDSWYIITQFCQFSFQEVLENNFDAIEKIFKSLVRTYCFMKSLGIFYLNTKLTNIMFGTDKTPKLLNFRYAKDVKLQKALENPDIFIPRIISNAKINSYHIENFNFALCFFSIIKYTFGKDPNNCFMVLQSLIQGIKEKNSSFVTEKTKLKNFLQKPKNIEILKEFINNHL